MLNDVGADHLNMDIQMEEANLYPGDVQEPLDDAVLGPHDAVIGPVHGVQQKPRKLSYSNIVFITALYFNKLKKLLGQRERKEIKVVSVDDKLYGVLDRIASI